MSVQYLTSYKFVYTDTAVVVHTAQIVTNVAAFAVMVIYFRVNPTERT